MNRNFRSWAYFDSILTIIIIKIQFFAHFSGTKNPKSITNALDSNESVGSISQKRKNKTEKQIHSKLHTIHSRSLKINWTFPRTIRRPTDWTQLTVCIAVCYVYAISFTRSLARLNARASAVAISLVSPLLKHLHYVCVCVCGWANSTSQVCCCCCWFIVYTSYGTTKIITMSIVYRIQQIATATNPNNILYLYDRMYRANNEHWR